MSYFKVVKRARVIGVGWQVRIRDASGAEDTVDILQTLAEAQRVYDNLLHNGMTPLDTRPE